MKFFGHTFIVLSLICSIGLAPTLYGAESVQGAVVTRSEGEATLMIKKNGTQPAGTTTISFENQTYYVRSLKKGDRPSSGDVITTGKDGKVRLIFRNGDQITVTPSTAYRFSWDTKSDKNALAELVYGDIRAVIQPGGPRTGMEVKTKSAVMGVRGTDFYASAWSKTGGSKVAVMRGKVAVAAVSDEGKTTKEAEVLAGTTGVVKFQPSQEKARQTAAIAIEKTTKEQLVVIQVDSKVALNHPQEKEELPPDSKQELAQLEKQATDMTLSDIQKSDPSLYDQIQKNQEKSKDKAPILDSDLIQTESVKKIFVDAPSSAPAPQKPTLRDLETGGDIYEKYKWEKH